jgi:hypothetical protein
MTITTSIILVVAIIAVALFIAYNVQKGTDTLEEMRSNYYDNEEVQEVEALAKQILDTPTPKRAPKKQEVTELVESMKKVTDAHDTLVQEIDRVTTKPTQQQVEVTLEIPKKKKGHRYNRKPKTQTPTT